MAENQSLFDGFVEKIVLHNKLAAPAQVLEAKTSARGQGVHSFLDQLVALELLHPRHAEQIRARFETWKQRSQPDEPASSASAAVEKSTDAPARTEAPEVESKPIAASNASPELSLKSLIEQAHQRGASDLHLAPGMAPMIRLDGCLKSLSGKAVTRQAVEEMIFSMLDESEQRRCRQHHALDGSAILADHRIRYTIAQGCHGWDGVFRLIPARPTPLEALHLPAVVEGLTAYREGLVLITGPSGSGKSTTLSALVDHINCSRDEHIITLEDPIETVFEMHRSQLSQRAVGRHTESFSRALRAALRQDPDVIVVGELRDKETTALAVSAAETGHLVFATLHTTSAPQTLNRLMDFFPPDQRNQVRAMVSESLRGVLCQRLIPRADGEGRVLAMEIMLNAPAIANVIREDRIYQLPNMIQLNRNAGMQLLDEQLQALVSDGVITGQEAYFAANNRQAFSAYAPAVTEEDSVHGAD